MSKSAEVHLAHFPLWLELLAGQDLMCEGLRGGGAVAMAEAAVALVGAVTVVAAAAEEEEEALVMAGVVDDIVACFAVPAQVVVALEGLAIYAAVVAAAAAIAVAVAAAFVASAAVLSVAAAAAEAAAAVAETAASLAVAAVSAGPLLEPYSQLCGFPYWHLQDCSHPSDLAVLREVEELSLVDLAAQPWVQVL